ncbi:cupin domain-containing protein [Microbacterium dauci]|uniref:Cupin domain-containing protein n=1 Tax=Microbacterium dauci TaxID=3048008 RepID=A0ABT6ZEM1_9MICO|nr:cupin domain-containing protein [Microbacterium sp. LX3-4]MDJ1114611.1 cupin domain-containing protein [Microbacterium sp. LX3-4]
MTGLAPNAMTDAATLEVPLEPVPAAQVLHGAPESGWTALTDTVGVWVHTPGVSTDVEEDELFVVLAGRATVTFPDVDAAPLDLGPGSVGRLAAGTATVWTVTETLRKVYVSGGG